MKNILITGGSGMIGKRLTEILLQEGYNVAWLSRKESINSNIKIFKWDIQKNFIDSEGIKWADAIINLAGETIAEKRWTEKRKKEIIESRTQSTALLKKYLNSTENKIQTIVAASAIGYYGEVNELVNENTSPGKGFLSESCVKWEAATKTLKNEAIRLITLRIGIVLSPRGGALKELTKTIPFAIAPILGNGEQIYSWVHIDDVCNMILFALQHKNINGTYNCVAPNPITQNELMKSFLKHAKKKAILFPVPPFILKLMLGEMADTVLVSQNISCSKIEKAGFGFSYRHIDFALKDLIRQ
ncbi:MAG: TIGR01777 family protein [Fimbriimonadaceae bacterium]|nr:TIGR01777 family protein [Chitinophagales bacterium]